MLLDAQQPALLVGESGSGKTMLCKSLISRARPHMHLQASPGLHRSDLCKALKKCIYQDNQINNTKVLKQPDLLLFIDDLNEAPFGESIKSYIESAAGTFVLIKQNLNHPYISFIIFYSFT